ncbi:MAG: metallophosphoesterase [Clostridiales bacterium]|nr:metallophosphoesterase [Clostridiales bacterium]
MNAKHILLGAAALGGGAAFAYDQNRRVVTTHYRVETRHAVQESTILHLSDLHSTRMGGLADRAAAIAPDLIAITGDLINDRGRNIDGMLKLCRDLTAICPVYYVPGNHEHRLESFERLMYQISDTGVSVLRDESESLFLHEMPVHILGLDEDQASFEDYQARKAGTYQYRDYTETFAAFSKKPGFRLVLSHYPENFRTIGACSYEQYDFDLMLAGHAHGGQVLLPLGGPLFSPSQGVFPKYARGRHGTRPALIVSRGIGNSEFPLRVFNHPQLVVIHLAPQR